MKKYLLINASLENFGLGYAVLRMGAEILLNYSKTLFKINRLQQIYVTCR